VVPTHLSEAGTCVGKVLADLAAGPEDRCELDANDPQVGVSFCGKRLVVAGQSHAKEGQEEE